MCSMKAETPVIRGTAYNLLLQWMVEPQRDFAEIIIWWKYSNILE